jgi:hypothetical protein
MADPTWAGNFDCSVCRRKRLVGSEFSKKMLERARKEPNVRPVSRLHTAGYPAACASAAIGSLGWLPLHASTGWWGTGERR